jgi:hypothetical protein
VLGAEIWYKKRKEKRKKNSGNHTNNKYIFKIWPFWRFCMEDMEGLVWVVGSVIPSLCPLPSSDFLSLSFDFDCPLSRTTGRGWKMLRKI